MFAQVAAHVVLEFELLVAHRARVLVRGVVFIHVMLKEVRALEGLHANGARVVVVVRQQMLHQVLLCVQGLVTYHTFQVTSTGVWVYVVFTTV